MVHTTRKAFLDKTVTLLDIFGIIQKSLCQSYLLLICNYFALTLNVKLWFLEGFDMESGALGLMTVVHLSVDMFHWSSWHALLWLDSDLT